MAARGAIPEGLIPPQIKQRNGKPATPTSGPLLAKLQSAAKRQREARRIEIDMPGAWAGVARVRYHGLALEDMERYTELVGDGSTSRVSVAVDLISACSEVVLVFNDDTQTWDEVCDEDGPVALDGRLAALLELPLPPEASVYDVVCELFIRDGNSTPLFTLLQELQEWLSEEGEDLQPGKSSAETQSSTSAEQQPSESRRT